MNPRILIHLLISSFVAGLLLIGCGSDDPPPVGGTDNEVVVKAVTSAPNLGDIVNDPVWDDVDVASIRVGADSIYTDYFGVGVVRVQAIQDGANVYMRFNWVDANKTDQPGRWLFDVPGQSSAFSQLLDTVKNKFGNFAYSSLEKEQQLWENEDVLSIFFSMGNGSVGANCALTCHSADGDTTFTGREHFTQGNGNIDCWVWRAGRTDPYSVAEDYYWRDNGKYDDYDSLIDNLYLRNSLTSDNVSDPRLMHINGSEYTGSLLEATDTTTLLYIGQAWERGDGLPGYIHFPGFRATNASRWDVNAKSEFDPQMGRWNLVLWRSLAAPHSGDDVTFTVGNSYEATLAIMKNTQKRHSGSQPFTIKF
ncbi:MAG: ethylbenzene dehydrogenase-related protein [Candidatus Zixiibacteriota bacterium]